MTDDGLRLLLDRSWGQEVIHQLVLRELLEHTSLATDLGLWGQPDPPAVLYEPFGGLFDLALALADRTPRVLIELKVGADLGDRQRLRQRARATELATPRVYILLGPSFFMVSNEPDARNIGCPELATSIRRAVMALDGAIGEVGRAYADRLDVDAAAWTAEHDRRANSGIDLFRLYTEIAAAWPVEVHPSKATNRGGPDWILNADAWKTSDSAGWESAQFYWEIVNGRTRFKIHWAGDAALRLLARARYRGALELAAGELGEPVSRTRAKAGAYMTALELSEDARDAVLADGRVDALLSRRLYDRATALFRRSLELLPAVAGE